MGVIATVSQKTQPLANCHPNGGFISFRGIISLGVSTLFNGWQVMVLAVASLTGEFSLENIRALNKTLIQIAQFLCRFLFYDRLHIGTWKNNYLGLRVQFTLIKFNIFEWTLWRTMLGQYLSPYTTTSNRFDTLHVPFSVQSKIFVTLIHLVVTLAYVKQPLPAK